MKKFSFMFILLFPFQVLMAQEIIYTVDAKYNNVHVFMDSILMENISNGSSVLLDELAEQEYVQIDLSNYNITNVSSLEQTSEFKLVQNEPGQLSLAFMKNSTDKVVICAYNLKGQKVFSSNKLVLHKNNLLNIQLKSTGIYLVSVESSTQRQTFKAVGSPVFSENKVSISNKIINVEGNKSAVLASTEDFNYQIGDSIHITPFVEGYYTTPAMLPIVASDSFTFVMDSTFIDTRDNKEYKTIAIGGQTWMKDPLMYLPEVSLSSQESATEPHYYVYHYNGSDITAAKASIYYSTYGVLYNWAAAKIACPQGWHLPTNEDWEQLAQYISDQNGGYGKESDDWLQVGKHLKTKSGWNNAGEENGNGTDDYGFSGLPGGLRAFGQFFDVGYFGNWWSASEYDADDAWARDLVNNTHKLNKLHTFKKYGLSVRCVKD